MGAPVGFVDMDRGSVATGRTIVGATGGGLKAGAVAE